MTDFDQNQFIKLMSNKRRYTLPAFSTTPVIATNRDGTLHPGDPVVMLPIATSAGFPLPTFSKKVLVNAVELAIDYTVTSADVGKPITTVCTATNEIGSGVSGPSTPVTVTPVTTMADKKYMAGNLAFLNDYDYTCAYVNLVETSRGFWRMSDGVDLSAAQLKANGHPSSDFEIFIQADNQPYTPNWHGTYKCRVGGTVTRVNDSSAGDLVLTVVNNVTYFDFVIGPTTGTNHFLIFYGLSADFGDVVPLEINRPGYAFNTGKVFTDEFLAVMANCSCVRFMDWLQTNTVNTSADVEWAGSTAGTTVLAKRGHTLARCILLANTLNVDMWAPFPVVASDDYLVQRANLIGGMLNSNLNCYTEYYNEPWNSTFFTNNNIAFAKAELAAEMRTSFAGSTNSHIVSCNRVSNVVTLTLSDVHTALVGDKVFVGGITGIVGGYVTVTAVTSVSLSWTEVAADATGTIPPTNQNAYCLFNPDGNELTKVRGALAYPSSYIAKGRFDYTRLKFAHDCAVTAGWGTRDRPITNNQLAGSTSSGLYTGPLWIIARFGSLSWLYTFAPAFYAAPTLIPGVDWTTPEQVIAALDIDLAAAKINAWRWHNALESFGLPLIGYEGGPHTDASKMNAANVVAMEAAHTSPLMRDFIKRLFTNWRDAGGKMMCFYTMSASPKYATHNGAVSGGSSFYIMQDIKNPTTSQKYLGYLDAAALDSRPASTDGLTWGTVSCYSAWQGALSSNGTAQGNGIYTAAFGITKFCLQIIPPTAGIKTIDIYMGGVTTVLLQVLLNGVEILPPTGLPTLNPFAAPANKMITLTVGMAAGPSMLTFLFSNVTGQSGLRQIVCT